MDKGQEFSPGEQFYYTVQGQRGCGFFEYMNECRQNPGERKMSDNRDIFIRFPMNRGTASEGMEKMGKLKNHRIDKNSLI